MKHRRTSLLALSVLVGLLTLSLALIVPPAEISAQTTISSTFDENADGWTTVGSTGDVTHIATGGNPGGHICSNDISGSTRGSFRAPSKFQGNLSFAYNGSLTFDLRQSSRRDQQFEPSDVFLVGTNGVTLIYDLAHNPGTIWTSYYIRMNETVDLVGGWKNQETEGAVSATVFQAVLSDVADLRIVGEYETGDDTGCLDSVVLAPSGAVSPPVPPTRVESTFDENTEGWDTLGSAEDTVHVATGGNPGGHICVNDILATGLWSFQAPSKFQGNVGFAYGGSLSFDLRQSSRKDQQFEPSDVVLVGNNGITLIYDLAYNPGTIWSSYYIIMDEIARPIGGWVNQETSGPVTQAQFQAVLAAVQQLRIVGEYETGDDTGCLDSVVLAAPGVVSPPAPPTRIESTFDENTEGWDTLGAAEDTAHVATGGNPGGHICANDISGSGLWSFQAPSKFQGNLSSIYNGSLSFSLKQSSFTSQVESTEDVYLIGNNGLVLVFNFPDNPGEDWTSYSVGMNETSGWVNQETSASVSAAEFQAVLAAVRELRIVGEYRTGDDTGCLDSVRLSTDPFVPPPTPTSTPTPTLTPTNTLEPSSTPTITPTPTLTLTPTLTPTMEMSPTPSPTYEVIGDPEIYPPVIRISPTAGQIINGATEYSPRLQWQPVDGAEWYHVYVATTDYSTVVFDQWFPASSVCAVETCTIPEDLWISGSGNFIWWMGYWNESIGSNFANTYNATTFTLSLEAPAPITEPSPSGTISDTSVTLQFAADPNVLWYRIWVGPADFSENLLFDWFPASEICTDGICTREIPVTLAVGDYEWWMETWSPAGYVEWFLVSQFTVAP